MATDRQQVKTYLTDEQYAELKRQAGKQGVSAFIAELLIKQLNLPGAAPERGKYDRVKED